MSHLVKNIRLRWPGNCIPFSFDAALTATEKSRILEAMNNWEATGHVRFVERVSHSRWVTFRPDSEPLDGTSSSDVVGMAGGQQFINIDSKIDRDPDPGKQDHWKRTLRHEIGHVLGFHHEHKRYDRGSFINVNSSQIADDNESQSQFKIIPAGEALRPGAYDLESVMHYGESKGYSKDKNTILITTDDPSKQVKIRSEAISPLDIAGIASFESERQQVYQLSHDGQIETVVEQSDWNSRWTTATRFTAGGGNFLFLLKRSNGTMHVQRIESDGSIGPRVQSRNWSSGWTHAVWYTIGMTDFMLLYKSGSGTVHIHKINGDGTIGERIEDGRLESDCIQVARYVLGFSNLMIFYKADGTTLIHEITWEGKIGQRKFQHDIGSGFTTVRPFAVGPGTYLLCLKSSDGTMKIRRIEGNGSVGSVLQTKNWSSDWTTAIPYHVGPNTYLLLIKSNSGDCHIHRIEHDGKVGPITDTRRLKPGWETVAIYPAGVGAFVLLVNP